MIRRKDDGASHGVAFDEEAYDLTLGEVRLRVRDADSALLLFVTGHAATHLRLRHGQPRTRVAQGTSDSQVPRPSVALCRAPSDGDGIGRRTRAGHAVCTARILPLDHSAPLFLEGYGAYGYAFATQFDTTMLSLVDRGFVYGIAHIRGGLEKGERWRDAGRREHKRNSFTDFIAVAEHLSHPAIRPPDGSWPVAIPRAAFSWAQLPTCGPICSQGYRPRAVRRCHQHHARRYAAVDGERLSGMGQSHRGTS